MGGNLLEKVRQLYYFPLLFLMAYSLPILSQEPLIPPFRFNIGGQVRGIAIDIENNRIYVGSTDNYLYCLDLFGNIKWKYNNKSPVFRVAYDKDNQQIYFQSKSRTYLCCMSSEGEFLWEYPIEKVTAIDIDPYTHYVYTSSPHNIHCLSPEGHLIWNKQISGYIGAGLVLDPKRKAIYCGSHRWDKYDDLYCLDYEGNINWSLDLKRIEDITIDFDTGHIYCASHNGYIYCLSHNGSYIWRYKTGHANSGITLDHNHKKAYCASSNGFIYCFNLDGWMLGKYEIGSVAWGSIVVHSELGHIYCGSGDGFLYCLPMQQGLSFQEEKIPNLEKRIKELEDIVGTSLLNSL